MINITLKHMYGTSVLRLARISSVRFYKNGSTKKLLEFLADMPKANTKRITEAQQQRHTISKKGEKYGASTVYLQVLGSGARGVPNTLYLFTDQKRYLFNCGECTQRLAHEHKVKLSRLEHIFITSKSWKNIGGLPGLSLTLQDVGVPKITLHGPDGLDELYNATKRFVIMKEMQVTMAPSSPTNDYEDSVMDVKYVHLMPKMTLLLDQPKPCKRARLEEVATPEYDQFTHDDTDYYTRGKPTGDTDKPKPRRSPSPDRADKTKNEKTLDLEKNCSVAYICTLKKRLGTLDLAKCVEKGVPPGPLLGQLKCGQDVMLSDGTIVLSKDVKTPDDPGPVFIVLELPDISYLSEAEFAAHFDNGANPPESIPAVIAHLSPPEVFHHPSYQAFMSKFGPSTRHLIVNAQNSCLGSEAVHRTQHKLHLLDPEVFPLLKDTSIPAEWATNPPIPKTNSPLKLKRFEELKNRIAMAQFQNIINAESPPKGDSIPEWDAAPKLKVYSSRTLTMFHLRPKRQINRSSEPKLHIQDYYQETMDVDGFGASLEKFHALVHDVRYAKSPPAEEYPKIVFLGTGSCIPSKTRNTSGIVVHVDDQTTILLDCGEGTFGQLVRFYGPRNVDEMLRTLKAIYISHLHADHHIGLIGVLQARAAAFADAPEKNIPVLLMAPGQIVTWLTMYDQQFEKIESEYTLIPNQSLMEDANYSEMTSAALARIGLDAVRTCLVPHCPNAFGVAVTAAGHKITYSGDTLPTQNLVHIGQNSSILIHEATMEDELADEARVKMHSTTSQAIHIGTQMNAKYTVLTHFSQRYARLPRLNSHILNNNDTVCIAFDNMQITISDLPLLPHMYAPLQLMFADHCVDMELKAATRVKRRERRSSSSSTSVASGATWNCRSRNEESKSRRSSKSSSATRSYTCSGGSSLASSPTRINYQKGDRKDAKSGVIMVSAALVFPASRALKANHQSKKCSSDEVSRDFKEISARSSASASSMVAHRLIFKETYTSRIRRLSSITKSSIKSDHYKKSPTPSCRKISSPGSKTPFASKSATPQTKSPQCRTPTSSAEEHTPPLASESASPQPRSPQCRTPTRSAEEHTRRPPNNSDLSKRAQELLQSVSSPSGVPVSPRKKSLMYDMQRRKNRSEEFKHLSSFPKVAPLACKSASPQPRSPQCRTPTRSADEQALGNEGYGKPLLMGSTRKLTIKTQPTPPADTTTPLASKSASPQPRSPRCRTPTRSAEEHNTPGNEGYGKPLLKGSTRKLTIKTQPTRPANTTTETEKQQTGKVISGFVKKKNSGAKSPVRSDVVNQVSSRNANMKSHIPIPKHGHTSLARDPKISSSAKTSRASSVNTTTVACSTRPNTNGAFSPVKAFKPQLEDIQSSFLLLNKQQKEIKTDDCECIAQSTRPHELKGDRNKTKKLLVKVKIKSKDSCTDNHEGCCFPQKPSPLNEGKRKMMLYSAKKNFQTKQYWFRSKYEKIEGLNWISWTQ